MCKPCQNPEQQDVPSLPLAAAKTTCKPAKPIGNILIIEDRGDSFLDAKSYCKLNDQWAVIIIYVSRRRGCGGCFLVAEIEHLTEHQWVTLPTKYTSYGDVQRYRAFKTKSNTVTTLIYAYHPPSTKYLLETSVLCCTGWYDCLNFEDKGQIRDIFNLH